MPELKAVAAVRQVLVQIVEPVPLNEYKVEVLADDTSFVFPDDLTARSVARQTLLQMPFVRPVNRYTVEVLAETDLPPMPAAAVFALDEEFVVQEIPTPDVSRFNVEVLAAASLDQQVNEYVVEVLGDSTDPNSMNHYVVEVLGDSTDDVSLTQQRITWFFNDH
ncbi:hypothetical protein D3C87_1184840 [compost metagenome]